MTVRPNFVPPALRTQRAVYDRTPSSALSRTRAEVQAFFRDWQLVEPTGHVWTPEWTIDGLENEARDGDMDAYRSQIVGGIARKL